MKGDNELRLNEATIIEAVQEYLAKRYTPPPNVTSVEEVDNCTGMTFKAMVEEVQAAQEKP